MGPFIYRSLIHNGSCVIVGAISPFGVVNVAMREPGNVKRRKVVGATKRKAPGDKLSIPKGIAGFQYLQFISDKMDIMDNFSELKGVYIVMDNAPINVPSITDPSITKRGYVPVYLPLYSPELNPIEQFWSAVKSKVKRHLLKDTETLTTRIIESCEAVPLKYLQILFGTQSRDLNTAKTSSQSNKANLSLPLQ